MTQRLIFSAQELAGMQARPVVWPAVSISLLCLFTIIAPVSVVTVLNIYLLGLVAMAWLMRGQPVERALVWAVGPFLVAIAVGFAGSFGADRYLVLKDAWYFANPAITIAVGYIFARVLKDTRRGLKAFVIGGVLVASLHASIFAMHPELLLRPAAQIRAAAGTGFQATALVVIILLSCVGRWRERLDMNPWFALGCLLLCTASVVLSFSRTMALVIFLGGLATAGFFARREWLRIGLLVLVALGSLGVLRMSVDTESYEAKQSFVGKLARSVEELETNDHMSIREVNANWRGYETARALDTFASGDALQWLGGHGFGAQVDLRIFQKLTPNPREAVRFIPIFHNGYMYLLIKTGIAGVVLYLLAMGWLYRVGRRFAADADERAHAGRLLQACVVILVITTWVVSGAFNKYDMFALLLLCGFLLARLTSGEDHAPA